MKPDSTFNVTAERIDFRTLGVLYETPVRKLSIMFDGEPVWTAIGDLSHWSSGKQISDSEKLKIIADLNDWGLARGWRFSVAAKNIQIEDVAPEHRELFRIAEEAARQEAEERKRIYG